MIPYDPKTEVCPYRTPEMREKWHKERGLEDSKKLPSEPEVTSSAPVEQAPINPGHTYGSTIDGSRAEREKARLAAYRLANKEKLAEKARERRAGKKARL